VVDLHLHFGTLRCHVGGSVHPIAYGQTHKIETESEFSPNTLELVVEAGKNYFIRQFIKMGVLSGGSDLEKMPEDQGQKAVAKLNLAKPGQCKTMR